MRILGKVSNIILIQFRTIQFVSFIIIPLIYDNHSRAGVCCCSFVFPQITAIIVVIMLVEDFFHSSSFKLSFSSHIILFLHVWDMWVGGRNQGNEIASWTFFFFSLRVCMYFCCLICIFSIMEFILIYEGMSSESCVRPSLHVPSSLDSLDLQTHDGTARRSEHTCRDQQKALSRSNFPSTDALVSMLETLRDILIKQRREREWKKESIVQVDDCRWQNESEYTGKHDKHKKGGTEDKSESKNNKIIRYLRWRDNSINIDGILNTHSSRLFSFHYTSMCIVERAHIAAVRRLLLFSFRQFFLMCKPPLTVLLASMPFSACHSLRPGNRRSFDDMHTAAANAIAASASGTRKRDTSRLCWAQNWQFSWNV